MIVKFSRLAAWLRVLGAMLALAYGSAALAATPGICRVNARGGTPSEQSVTLTSVGQLPLDAPAGTFLTTDSAEGDFSWSYDAVDCPDLRAGGPELTLQWRLFSNLQVVDTPAGKAFDLAALSPSMKGVGLLMTVTDVRTGNKVSLTTLAGQNSWQTLLALPSPASNSTVSMRYSARFVKTGPFSANGAGCSALVCFDVPVLGIMDFRLLRVSDTSVEGFSDYSGPSMLTASPTIVSAMPTCAMSAFSNHNVALGDFEAARLANVGDEADAPNGQFSLSFNCPGVGQAWLSFTDATTPGNVTSDLTLDPASTAKGLVLRLVNTDQASTVVLGPECRNGTSYIDQCASVPTLNLTPLGSGPLLKANFKVRYRRTASVQPGSVLARAIYTVVYR